jgi:hypothetical protein
MALTACSPGADYPSIFPAVHDMPPPRPDAPLDSVQIQRATEDLITAREHLTAETQGQPKSPANSMTNPPVISSASATSTSVMNPPPAKKPPAAQTPAALPGGVVGPAADGPQTAGTETKP